MNFIFTYTPLKFFVQSFWRDEAFSYLLAKRNILEIITLTAQDFTPPLYYITLHIWMNIFGTSEIALRSLSLIFFWGTVYIAFDFMHDVMGITYKKGVSYMLFFLLNPLLAYYAFEARAYTMLAFFAILSFYALHTKRKKLYLAALLGGLFTHYFMVLIVFTQLVYIYLMREKKKFEPIIKQIKIALIVYTPWILYIWKNRKSEDQSFWVPKVEVGNLFTLPAVMYTGMEPYLNYLYKQKPVYLFSMIAITLVIVLLVKTVWRSARKDHVFWSLFLWAVLPPALILIVSIFKPLFLPRYLIFSGVGLILLIVYCLENVHYKVRMVCAIVLLFLTIQHLVLQTTYRSKENINKTIHEIQTFARPNDVLYVSDVLDFHTAQYYFDEDRVFIYNQRYDKIPAYVGKVLIPPEKIKTTLPTYPQKAFILKKNGSYEIRALY